MNRKAGKFIFGAIGLVMFGTILFWGFRSFVPSPFVKDTVFQKTPEESAVVQPATVGGAEEDSRPEKETTASSGTMHRMSELVGVLPDENNTYGIGDTFSQQHYSAKEHTERTIACRVNRVDFTKNNVDTDAVYSVPDIIEFDEEYNIKNDFTYVVANVTFLNKEDFEMEIYVNFVWYVAVDSETGDAVCSGEMRGYKTQKDLLEYDKSYAKVTIPAGGEFECNLVYIQRDDEIEGKESYLKFNSSGVIFPADEDSCYVKVG